MPVRVMTGKLVPVARSRRHRLHFVVRRVVVVIRIRRYVQYSGGHQRARLHYVRVRQGGRRRHGGPLWNEQIRTTVENFAAL